MLTHIHIEIQQVFVKYVIVHSIEHKSLESDDVDELHSFADVSDEIDEMLLKHQLDVQIVFELDEQLL